MSITAYTTLADGTEDSFKGNLQALTQDSVFIKKDTLENAFALDQITRLEVEKDRTTGKVLFLVFGILLALLGAIVLVLALLFRYLTQRWVAMATKGTARPAWVVWPFWLVLD
ncbi:MAG: hypothetical protein IPL65_15340 [Lewinellaceae bacterium]|nr:hypothetical protein [Lewinellaceae bacterium]